MASLASSASATPDHPTDALLDTLKLLSSGDLSGAVPTLRDLAAAEARTLGPDNGNVSKLRHLLAQTLAKIADADEAANAPGAARAPDAAAAPPSLSFLSAERDEAIHLFEGLVCSAAAQRAGRLRRGGRHDFGAATGPLYALARLYGQRGAAGDSALAARVARRLGTEVDEEAAFEALRAGDAVEARYQGDELFFAGVVASRSPAAGTFTVTYEDGVVEEDIPENWVQPYARVVVHEDDEVRVLDGHMVVDDGARIAKARILAFASSPQLYQSALVLAGGEDNSGEDGGGNGGDGGRSGSGGGRSGGNSAGSADVERIQGEAKSVDVASCSSGSASTASASASASTSASGHIIVKGFRRDIVPFEINQTLLLMLAFLPSPDVNVDVAQVVVIGAGGVIVPMAIEHNYPGRAVVDVVDLSGPVLRAAEEHFAATPSDTMRLHEADGVVFLADAVGRGATFDVVAVDAAAADAIINADLELPPACFVEESFLRDVLKPSLAPQGGFMMMNVIGEREMLITLCDRFRDVFTDQACYIIAIDPNYIFCAFAEPPAAGEGMMTVDDALGRIRAVPGLEAKCPLSVKPIIKTAHYVKKKVAMGWFTLAQFRDVLLDDEFMV